MLRASSLSIIDKFDIAGRGIVLSAELPKEKMYPHQAKELVGQFIDYKGIVYEIRDVEVMRCLLAGCMCVRSFGLVCKKI